MNRRDFLKNAILTGIGVLIGGSVVGDLLVNKLSGGSKTTTVTEIPSETVVIKVVPQTYTQTYTQTVTQTVTEYSNTTVTETQTPTQTNPTTTQPPQSLEEILFGDSDMSFIPLEVTDVQIGNSNAHITVYDYVTNTQLQIEIPLQYVSNGNINIGNLLSAVNSYNSNNGTNYKLYLVLGRAGLNQAIQQNGQWLLPASQIYYNILISDRGGKDVYNALQNLGNGSATVVMPDSNQGPYSNSLWGWSNVNDESIIIEYQNGQQVNSVTNYINLADYILGTPNNSNPTSGGILHVDTIANTQQVGVYNSGGNQYPVYGVNDYYITLIDFETEQGTPLFSNL